MSSKAKRKTRDEGGRPSTFFIIAIVVALVILVGAFVGYVSKTPGARPASTTTSLPAMHLPSGPEPAPHKRACRPERSEGPHRLVQTKSSAEELRRRCKTVLA